MLKTPFLAQVHLRQWLGSVSIVKTEVVPVVSSLSELMCSLYCPLLRQSKSTLVSGLECSSFGGVSPAAVESPMGENNHSTMMMTDRSTDLQRPKEDPKRMPALLPLTAYSDKNTPCLPPLIFRSRTESTNNQFQYFLFQPCFGGIFC